MIEFYWVMQVIYSSSTLNLQIFTVQKILAEEAMR